MALAGIINKIWHLRDNLVLPKASGKGILTDPDAPTYCWRDLEGTFLFDDAGANALSLAAYRGGLVRQYAASASDKVDCIFHIPHDWAPGSDLYLHVHWSHNGTTITGNIQFDWAFTHAKGHNQANFPAEKTAQVIYATTNIATTPQYRHRIEEVAITAGSADSNHFDRADIEVDGLLLVTLTMGAIPTITGGSPNEPFIHCIDLHYQSTGVGTKQKAPNFYT